ncbi:MAG: hypothetical protein PUD90_12045 [Clostridia bacterium]|nr:hypothetical protein [Clostridia bacterium]
MIFIIVLILSLAFTAFVKYTYRRDRLSESAYLERESKANSTRRQSLDSLDYITIPLDSLPFFTNPSKEIASCQETIRHLASCRIVNLQGITNTDLKLAYGAANLPALSEYDNNYASLTATIVKWGEQLINENHIDEAVRVLEFGIECGADTSSNYILLASCYIKNGDSDKFNNLRNRVHMLNTPMKKYILKKMDELNA